MKLLYSQASPFARKVTLTLHETGLTDRVAVEVVATTPVATAPALAAANPLGKIPCLIRDDAPALFDSRVITRFLDSLHAGRKLYPTGAGEFATLTLEALADGIMDAAVAAIYEVRLRPEGARSRAWIDAQLGKVARALDAAEAQWLSHLAGPVDAGAIAMAAALGYLDFRHGALGWRDGRPGLAAWHAGFAARPSYAATAPVG